MDKKQSLKGLFYYGTFLDGMMSVVMLWSIFSVPPFIIPYSSSSIDYRFAMGWAAIFMIGWTILLFWASRKPVERKEIWPITLYIIVTGLAATCLIVDPIELLTTWLFQIFGIIFPGTIVYLWAKDAE